MLISVLMTGLCSAALAARPAEEVVQRFEEQSVTFTGGDYQDEVFRYRLLKPSKIEPGKKYPVVLFLHGAGERGHDNTMQLLYLPEQMSRPEWREKFPCFLIAPQCREGQQWVEVPWSDPKSSPMKQPGSQMRVVMRILQKVRKEQPADERRVYLTGLSMGGYGTWDLAARHPEWFAAAAPICGGGDEQAAGKLKDMPLWAFHGDQDNAVPVGRTRSMIEAVRQAGGKPKYSELPGVGHNSWVPAYGDPEGLIPWMFEQAMRKDEG
ncbi:MAG: dienelactone hydrolase family protein [Pirellulales bacterium]